MQRTGNGSADSARQEPSGPLNDGFAAMLFTAIGIVVDVVVTLGPDAVEATNAG